VQLELILLLVVRSRQLFVLVELVERVQLFVSNCLQDAFFEVKWLHRVKHTEHFVEAPVIEQHLVDALCDSALDHRLVSLDLDKDGKKAELYL
jgi:hypothetical protein